MACNSDRSDLLLHCNQGRSYGHVVESIVVDDPRMVRGPWSVIMLSVERHRNARNICYGFIQRTCLQLIMDLRI